jgi:type II secretory pathway component PulK
MSPRPGCDSLLRLTPLSPLGERGKRSGYVLFAVMIVIVVLSLAAYRFADSMTSEFAATVRSTEAAQARAHAVSAIHYAIAMLNDPATLRETLGGNPYNNADYFANVPVDGVTSRGGGRFSLIHLTDTGGGTGEAKFALQYGVIDEAGKVNINSLMRIDSSGESVRSIVALLPNMTQEVADAIVDWVHPEQGTIAYEGYAAKKGPLSSVDELLLVQGITADKLYGNDRNRNGRADLGEADGQDFNRGWSDYLTVYGHELNVDSTGAPRVYLNDTINADYRSKLTAAVGSELADYICAYRMYGGSTSLTPLSSAARVGSANDLSTAVNASLSTNPRARSRIRNSSTSLYNTRVRLPKPPGSPPNTPDIYINSPLNDRASFVKLLPQMLDQLTTKTSYELNPRINIATAPQDLLMALPGLTAEDVSAAVAARANITPGTPDYLTGAWMVTQAGQRPEVFQQLERYITGYTMTYRIHAIGYFVRGGPVARVEAVIDLNGGKPRIVYYRDLTDLGGGFTPPR